ncbi:MAG TPA: mycofactocin precursor MftA [Rubrobacteraceae bacterium]|jgi:mycofactocin precursor|nr:mycofactocin precursor MftA [Rubrobacteraceae bacterium]
MKSLESKVTLVAPAGASTTYSGEETSPKRTEVAYEAKGATEKPRVSEEIAIEEINIDGMCGVY